MKKNIENKDILKKSKEHYETIIKEKNKKVLESYGKINKCKKEINILFNENEDNKIKIINLNNSLNQYEKKLAKKNEEINKIQIINNNNKININNLNNVDMVNTETEINKLKKENENINQEIKQLKDENDGLKEFAIKIKDKEEKITEENINYKEKISILQKENNEYKQYFKDKKNNSEKNGEDYINIISELNEAKKEIKNVKKKNEELFNELENKKFVNHYRDNLSEGKVISNYEEEFDLKKMAKGAMDKNRSQDINIDYPGVQQVKEKYRQLDFYYNYLEDLVKKLLLNSTCTNKNKAFISELCKIVGFDDNVSNKILNNKSKKGLLNMFG